LNLMLWLMEIPKQLQPKSLFPIQNKSKWSKTKQNEPQYWIVSWHPKAWFMQDLRNILKKQPIKL
jgi:hypothetical protein